jgi:outer membrane murein-binding lipoprotein Lpp
MQQDNQDHFDDFENLTGADHVGDEAFAEPTAGDEAGRRKRRNVFYGAVFVILCLGALGGWYIFAGNQQVAAPIPAPKNDITQESVANMQQQATTPTANAVTMSAPLPEGVSPAVNAPSNQVVLPVPMPSDMPGAQAESASSASGLVPTDAMPSPADPNATTASALPAPDDAAPAIMQQSQEQLSPTETPVAETSVAPAVVDTQSAERLSAMESQLQTLAAELTAVKAVAPTASNPDPALSGKLQQLTSQFEQMTSQLDALDQRTTTLATEVQNAGNKAAEATPSPEKIIPKDKVIAVQEEETLSDEMPKPAEPVKKVAKAPVKKASVKKAASPTVVRSWELRSAQPGIAWLGRPGSGEMARYAVGENVPGLGSVRSVSQDANGNWVVNTSGGTIKQ